MRSGWRGLKSIAERERAECCVAAGAAATDYQSIAVDFATLGEIARAVDAIVDVDDADWPFSLSR